MDTYALKCPDVAFAIKPKVTYGKLQHKTYYSNTTKCQRAYTILLPSDYTEEKKYPVIYFQHGIFGDEHIIPEDPNNKIREVYSNLLDEGKIEEMIFVFPNMYVSSDSNMKPAFNQEAIIPYNNFIYDLINDLIPHIESTYSVKKDRKNRALLGFSLGGRQSLFVGLSRPDLFGYIGAISPAPGLTPGKDWAMEHPGQFSIENLRFQIENYTSFIMLCCGEKDNVVGNFPKEYHNLFTKNNITHDWYEITNADHDNVAIRTGYYNYLQKVFK